jgi:hypothetical protein
LIAAQPRTSARGALLRRRLHRAAIGKRADMQHVAIDHETQWQQ